MKEYEIIVEASSSPEDKGIVMRGLRSYNISQAGDPDVQQLNVFLRDETETVVGGLLCLTYWGWLSIETIWITDFLRRKGYGTKLVATAEAEALKRGCRHAILDTYSFQARSFYEHLGYETFGVLENFPAGHQRVFMRKTLNSS